MFLGSFQTLEFQKINLPQNLSGTSASPGRSGNPSLDVKPIAEHQQMRHTLIVIGICASDVVADEDAGFVRIILLGGPNKGHN